ncbi:uncharacterized protein B0T23DRAFT_368515 [Neurospora hispaniola]|uniref:Uncharacterized protein n=1 Tax=Neurospora hispaniola TaxID=588809 RepID=A0AAJ0IE72_9PEZI|nr:hypothetical protein B0T23DRAFT_368515 [Neurospora hispaniola]
MDPPSRPLPPIHHLNLELILIPPILLAIATALSLFTHSDTDLYMLYSQCHSHARIEWLSRVPLFGPLACFLVSFFQEALLSPVRSKGIMSVILSYVAGLLTITTVESSRICNQSAFFLAFPTATWLIFDLVGGALVWEIIIIPAFFHRAKLVILARRQGTTTSEGEEVAEPELILGAPRHLSTLAESISIPVSIAIGYILPSLLILLLPSDKTTVPILVWLFFPVWVSFLHQGVRTALLHVFRDHPTWPRPFHLETSLLPLVLTYAAPILLSLASHIYLIVTLFTHPHDDRKEMTLATTRFIMVNMVFVGLTVLYWAFIEAGWQTALVMLVVTVLAGPGAGVCVGWIWRESAVGVDWIGRRFGPRAAVIAVAVGGTGSRRGSDGERDGERGQVGGNGPSEETPLLR